MLQKIAITTLVLSITACGAGSGKGLDNQGLPIKDTTQPPPDQNNGVTLASLQQNIFGAICVNCHTGSNAPRGLRLDSEDNAYAFLVNHAADEVPELMRVNPGNSDASYIIRKLEGASGIVGSRMPLGGPYLTQTQINTVRDWIANGAPRTGTGSLATRVSQTQIQKTGDDVSANVHFSRALEPDSVTEKNISLFYTTAESTQPIAIDHIGLVTGDQSVDISINQLIPNTAKISVVVHSPDENPILDLHQQNITTTTTDGIQGDSPVKENNGSDYRYETILP